jgi:kynurenine 3-monooxygenase
MLTNDQPNRVAVIGAGLVGALTAAMLSARGWNVDLFELRSDPRLTPPSARGRSINLALSPRGIEALRSVSEELANRVQTEGVAMRGRMVHSRPKSIGAATTQEGQDYGVYEEGEYIASISRSLLSIYLLDHLDTLGEESVEEKVKSGRGTVTTYFNHKMISMDMRKSQGVGMVFKVDQVDHEGKKVGEAKQVDFQVDFVIGGDGAYSKVRAEMMRGTR